MAGKRSEQKASTRSRVVEQAKKMFAELGYDRTTIRDVASALHLSTGAVFAHFSGKDALFEAATGREPPTGRIRKLLEAAVALESSTIPPAEAQCLLTDLFGAKR